MPKNGSLTAQQRIDFGLTEETVDLVGLLRLRAEKRGRQRAFTFLVDGDSERVHTTYEQLDERARAIGAFLQSQGLEGERALLLFPSGLEFVAAFFGCLYAGVVAVPAYPPRRNRNMQRIQSIVNDAKPRIALTTHDVFERIEPLLEELPDLAAIPWRCTRDIATEEASSWNQPKVTPETLAFLQYTSGSTGTPKGVMLSHGNLLHNTAIISAAFKPTFVSSGVTWLPLYHDMGLIGGIIQPIYFGQPVSVMTPTHFLQKPLRWLQLISDSGALISGGPNFAYELCVERVTEEEKRNLDLSQWELAFNGAEPVRAETIDRFCKAFASCGFRREAFYPCYGLAEATLLVAGGEKSLAAPVRSFDGAKLQEGEAVVTDPKKEGAVRLVGIGTSLLEQEIVIVDPETLTECPQGHVGEIWVSGPSVAQGYWQREEATQETFQACLEDGRGPFLRTGDLGCFHGEEGEVDLFINGRLKDLIIIRGVNHYPQDLELTAEQAHEDLRPAAGGAFSIGGDGAEQLVVVQEVVRKRDIDYDAVCHAIRKEIALHHDVSPQAIVLIKPHSIPKTSSGKIQRHACRKDYEAGELSIVAEGGRDGTVTVHSRRRRGKSSTHASELDLLRTAAGVEAVEAKRTKPKSSADREKERAGVVDRVMQIIASVAQDRAARLTLESDIAGLGLDSLERMEIVADLEKEFGGRFTEDAILSMETCQDVVDQVRLCLLGETTENSAEASTKPQPSDYVFSESPEYRRLQATIRLIDDVGLRNPFFSEHQGITNDTALIDGKEYINFCSYNYIGMSGDPVVHEAAKRAIDQFGSSTSASRLVSGEKTVHRELEKAIAEFVGTEDAIVMPGGHATNESVIGHMFGPGDLILHDALAHNSILQGCLLSGATRRAFPHNDWRACEKLLKNCRSEYRRVVIAIEGVYSMDGDYSDVAKFVALKEKYQVYLYLDEAHSVGVMGATGRGMGEFQGVDSRRIDFCMGTISKSLGSCGGYVAASKEIVEYLKYTAPGFVFSGGITPANTAAALASLRLLQAEPDRIVRLRENSQLFLTLAKKAGFNTGFSCNTPIIPIILGNSLLSLRVSQKLYESGVNVQPIMHPAVEEEAARLRFFITSDHSEDQISTAIRLLVEARSLFKDEANPSGINLAAVVESSLGPADAGANLR